MAGSSGGDMTEIAASPAPWIAAQVESLGARLTGPIEEIHRRAWSTVLRVPTDRGALFFKSSAPEFGREAAVTAYLAHRRPDVVPAPLAIDAERGWMLMADAGVRLRDLVEAERDVRRWLDVLPIYAGLQLSLADDVTDLLALGVPDMRLAVLPGRFERLLDELAVLATAEDAGRAADLARLHQLAPRVAAECARLAAYGICETIQHDDLHDGAVYVRDGRHAVLDWGDACVSHPFFSMSVTLEGVIAWGCDDVEHSIDTDPYRDAYLAPFAAGRDGHDQRELREAFGTALRLGWVCRAINGHLPADSGPTWNRLRMFLDGHP